MTKLDNVRTNLLNAYQQRDELQSALAKANEVILTCRNILAGAEIAGEQSPEVSE